MSRKFLFCLLAVLALSACGVKPKSLKPPEGAADVYPHSYPAPDAE